MKKVLALFVALLVMPIALATSATIDIPVDIGTEDFAPLVWLCDSRVVYDDATEPGRFSDDGEEMLERLNNYAFEGEQIQWEVLVMDKNGINKVMDVYATVGYSQGEGNPIEVNCIESQDPCEVVKDTCNARILEEDLTDELIDPFTQRYYTCTLTVETAESMYGEMWITVEAEDLDGLFGTMDENEYWFLNPVIDLAIDGALSFMDVRPGTSTYSETILVGNAADDGSGVMLDMFISGTDFYDPASSGAMCPVSNVLELSNFAYYAVNGAYSTYDDWRSDAEGYVPIQYGIAFNDPNPFYFNNEIMQVAAQGPYFAANVLAPGAELAMTFRLNLPEPCNGDFSSGSLHFFGEAI